MPPLALFLPSLFLPAPAAVQECATTPSPETVERRLAAMGTWLALEVRADGRATALAASENAVRALETVEARLSTWREDSELARLNDSPVGAPFELSPALASDLAGAAEFWRATDGAFDPGLGALVAAWDLRGGGREPDADELEAARAVGGWRGFALSEHTCIRLHPGAGVEEGGFGKGIGLDAGLAALADSGAASALLDLGGQLAVFGEAVTARLADPRVRDRAVLELEVPPGSLATSGNGERGIRVNGVPRGHVLDPRTGMPSADFGSLTVWATTATAADCLSTGLYVLGPERAFAWRLEHPGIELAVLCSRPDGGLLALVSEGLARSARALVPELELVWVPGTPEGPRIVQQRLAGAARDARESPERERRSE